MPEGDIVLLHLRTTHYFTLNTTGALLWEMLGSSSSLDAMSQALSDRFDVTRSVARSSVMELLRDLKANQLIDSAEIIVPQIGE